MIPLASERPSQERAELNVLPARTQGRTFLSTAARGRLVGGALVSIASGAWADGQTACCARCISPLIPIPASNGRKCCRMLLTPT